MHHLFPTDDSCHALAAEMWIAHLAATRNFLILDEDIDVVNFIHFLRQHLDRRVVLIEASDQETVCRKDAEFISASRSAVPLLLDTLDSHDRAIAERDALLREARLLIRHTTQPSYETAGDATPDEWWTPDGVRKAGKDIAARIDALLKDGAA